MTVAAKAVDILLDALPDDEGRGVSTDIDVDEFIKSSGGFGIFMRPFSRGEGQMTGYKWSKSWPYLGRATISLQRRPDPHSFYIRLVWDSAGFNTPDDPVRHIYADHPGSPGFDAKLSQLLRGLIHSLEVMLPPLSSGENTRSDLMTAKNVVKGLFDEVVKEAYA